MNPPRVTVQMPGNPPPPESEHMISSHLKLLGLRVKDRVTGFGGVVTSVTFDLYGCVQALVNPGLDDKGMPRELQWFDEKRLQVTAEKPVMAVPAFAEAAFAPAGPEDKPRSQTI